MNTTIRSQIRPFAHTVTYPTGWGGELTFEQIADRLSASNREMLNVGC